MQVLQMITRESIHPLAAGVFRCLDSSGVRLKGCSGDALERTAVAEQAYPAGSVLVCVPWHLALSSESALQRLHKAEKEGVGVQRPQTAIGHA